MALTEAQIRERIKIYAPLIQKYPSPISVATRIAQCIVESQLFTSELAKNAKNGFGIKASKPWTGATHSHLSPEVGGARVSKFRAYSTEEESIKDHAGFYTSTPYRANVAYKKAIEATTYIGEAGALTGVYAGDLEYGKKLVNVIEKYDLTQYDKKESGEMAYAPKIIDRRQYAMGGQAVNRNKSAITAIAWHYTAVARRLNRKIWDHEQYWKNTHKWDRGGYHYYIDSDGVIYHNYNYERISYGVAYNNDYTVHISVEANHRDDYSEAQKQARNWLTRKIMADLNIKSNRVLQHKEVYNNSNCCGYTKEEMDVYRKQLAQLSPVELEKDDRFVDLPTYTTPKNPFKALKVGDKITIRQGLTAWYDPNKNDGVKPSKNFTGDTDEIVRVMNVNIGYSKRAYLLKDKYSWILEQDIEEARSHWKEVKEEEPEQAIPEDEDGANDDLEPVEDNDFSDNYIYWDGKKYEIGNEVK